MKAQRVKQRTLVGVTAGVAALVLTGCGDSDLAEEDPDGYRACVALRDALGAEDTRAKLGGLLEAGRYAAVASTEEIRAASTDLELEGGAAVADVDQLTEACAAAGVTVE